MTDSKSKRHIEAPRAKQKQGVLNIIWPREAGQLMKHNGLKWVCSSYKGVLINRNYGLLQRNSEKGNPWPGRETTRYQVSLLHSPDTPFPIMASINQIPQEARVKEKVIDEVSKSWSSGARVGWWVWKLDMER